MRTRGPKDRRFWLARHVHITRMMRTLTLVGAVAALGLAFLGSAHANSQGQWRNVGQVSKTTFPQSTYTVIPMCPTVDQYVNCTVAVQNPVDVCHNAGCDGVVANSYCPELSGNTGSGKLFNYSTGSAVTCCQCPDAAMPEYAALKNDMIFYKSDPAVMWGVESALFNKLDPVNQLAHVETCSGSSGGFCYSFWGQRSNMDLALRQLMQEYRPSGLGKFLRWMGTGFSKRKATCNVLLSVVPAVAATVRNVGKWGNYTGTPRAAAAFIFRPTYVPSATISAFATRAASTEWRPYDFASLTTYNTNGYTGGWGGCSAATSSAWDMSTAEGNRATNKSAAVMCGLAKSIKSTVLNQLGGSGIGYDFLGTEMYEHLESCSARNITAAMEAELFVNAFLNGAFAAESRGAYSLTNADGSCVSTVVKEVNFVTAPSDLYHNMLGGSPGTSYAQPTAAFQSACVSGGGQGVVRNGVARCWYPKTSRSATCPSGSTFEAAPISGVSPGGAFAQANPLYFTDGNDKCLKALVGY